MLLLDSRCAVIDGVSVFPDHADPAQWYYLPTRPHLSVVDGTPVFQLIGFRGARTGGLLSFDCDLSLGQAQVDALRGKVKTQFDLDVAPRLAPVPPVDGTVHLISMGTDSSAPAGEAPAFVVDAVHNAKPSLVDDNTASFSVLLDETGYALVEGTLDAAILPVAVVYSLDHLALRPAYRVTLSIDWDRVQKHLDETFGAKAWIFSADISRAVDELDDSKAIDLRADTFVTEDTEGVVDRRDAALAQVKAMITSAFFEPSLPPWKPDEPSGWVQDLEALGDFATRTAAAAAGGPAVTNPPVTFSYKKTDYTRIDRKNLDVTFSERTTVRRSIYPQGHLASLFSAISASPELRGRLVREISPDEFFTKRKLQVLYRPNLGAPFIDSIDVKARYGGLTRNALLTPDDWSTTFEWLSDVHDGVVTKDVDVSYDVRFKAADTSERPGQLTSAHRPADADLVSLLPEDEVFTVRSVAVLAERIPWTRFDTVEVHVRYRDADHGVDQQDVFRLVEKAPSTVWPVFVVDRDHRVYEVRTVLRAVDGNDVDSGWATSDLEEIQVRNPFRARTLAVLANVRWTEVSDVFVDVTYEDPAHDVLVQETLHLTQTVTPPPFVVDLRDPTRTGIEFTVTFSYLDGRVVQTPPSTTFAPRITVDPAMRGHRVVQVRPPADWTAKGVERVTVELRFEDFAENLSFADRFELDGPGTTARFEFDYADVTRDRYEWRETVLYRNGLRHTTDWTTGADAVLVPRLP
ncbi:hypothetical protein [Kineococcus rhizosphaerae]|uniref:Uncharacterized protein n=1 Tax=Kineococcus rhizosphaerae TaxID=559628 RepID=A0A2T0R8J0_9ACTN|nr:hypothetical protein [Kineococcus rhizosphaerae]PRY17414.1 hypothetical protein CLV37_102377 [Kineococcus rhizosphaerae]